ncbi:MAG: prolyl oligopeptidase family serine peptidase, partial [Candidatus Neomarinimicrobiota bacterium]
MRKTIGLLAFVLIGSSCAPPPPAGASSEAGLIPAPVRNWTYPESPKGTISDDYHGTRVDDPYRWLEDPASVETKAWVAAQNVLTRSVLDAIPARDKIRDRLTELWNYPRYEDLEKHGEHYYFFLNDGLQDQAVLYRQAGLSAEPEVVMDPNTFSDDGTTALGTMEYSWDGRFLAYGKNAAGSDWGTLHIRDLLTGRDLPESFDNMRYTGLAWNRANTGFYYNKYPDPGTVPEEDNYHFQRVFWHQLGTPISSDRLVFEMPTEKDLSFYPQITDDGDYLVLWVYRGTDDRYGLYYRPVDGKGEFVHLFEVEQAQYRYIGNTGSTFYIHTDEAAPRGRVISLDINAPGNHSELIAEGQDVISDVNLFGGQLMVRYMVDAHEVIKQYGLDGTFVRDLPLPTDGSLDDLSGGVDDQEMFFSFTSFLYPTTIYRYDFAAASLEVFRQPEIDFNFKDYQTTQVFYPSKDGTQVPMFLTHKKRLELNGDNPVLLYGYGGFNISILPGFQPRRLVLIENGFIFALANIRGGSEYGEDWHQAGMLDRKQNVFDDFIAAGEWLIEQGYT